MIGDNTSLVHGAGHWQMWPKENQEVILKKSINVNLKRYSENNFNIGLMS
jgi:hypothetical protein